MSQAETDSGLLQTEVDSLFVPVKNHRLLVPAAGVAEVVQQIDCEPAATGPGWLLGWMEWRLQRIPLISFERLGGAVTAPEDGGMALVLHTMTATEQFRFYALQIQGFPHLMRVTPADLMQEMGSEHHPFSLMAVAMDSLQALIPDFEQLEAYVSQHLSD
ncbi:chemotaxis protein CheW [Porticoccus sp.]